MQEFTQAKKDKALDALQATGQSLAFPDVWLFGELFEQIEPYDCGPSQVQATFPSSWDENEPCRVIDYCHVSQGNQLRVRPTKALIDYLKGRFVVPGDISFQVVVRKDGSALVTARMSHIIANAWLALVSAASVPGQEYSDPNAKAIGRELFT